MHVRGRAAERYRQRRGSRVFCVHRSQNRGGTLLSFQIRDGTPVETGRG